MSIKHAQIHKSLPNDILELLHIPFHLTMTFHLPNITPWVRTPKVQPNLTILTRKKKLSITTIHCNLFIATYGEKMYKQVFLVVVCSKNHSKKLLVDNQIHLSIHCLIMSCNGQVTTDDFNEQLFF